MHLNMRLLLSHEARDKIIYFYLTTSLFKTFLLTTKSGFIILLTVKPYLVKPKIVVLSRNQYNKKYLIKCRNKDGHYPNFLGNDSSYVRNLGKGPQSDINTFFISHKPTVMLV